MQAVAGNLAERFGPKWFLFVTMIIGAIFNLLIPVMAASLGSIGVMICRVVQGLTQGFLYPSIQNLISRWTPQSERARIANFVYGGAPIGIAMSMPITGAIAETKYGWPMVFYSFGALGFLWAVIFAIFAANSPETHRGITQEERDYIESSTSVTTYNKKVFLVCLFNCVLNLIFEGTDNSLEIYFYFFTSMGDVYCWDCTMLGWVYTPYRNTKLHEQCYEF